MRRFLLYGLAILAVLVAGLTALRLTDEHLDLASGQKLAEMRSETEPVTFVAVGSSRTKFHIIPSVLDSTMAAHGIPVRSFNYGILGTPATEVSYSVDRLLGADLPALRTIAVELQPLPLRELHWHVLSRKGAYHFDFRRVRLGIDATHASDLPPDMKRAAYGRFLRLGVRHYLLAGQGTNLLRSWARQGRSTHASRGVRGFVPLDRTGTLTEQKLELLRTRYRTITDLMSGPVAAVATAKDSVIARHFLDMDARAAARGIDLLFIVQPMTVGVEGVADLLEQAGQTVVRMNDPADYPELYDLGLWYDESHLNAEGAYRVTETAARAMAEALARAPG